MRVVALIALVGLVGCTSTRPTTRPGEDQERRAGYPAQVSRCARPSDTGAYVGYEVGGGAAWCGHGPTYDDGTWGWDYSGRWLPSNVMLGWWHGTRQQGGAGAYRTDGPRPIQAIERRGEK